MRWLRRIIRKHMNPIHELDAMMWKRRLAVLYVFMAWNTMGVLFYYIWQNKNDWAYYYGLKTEEEKNLRPGFYYADLVGKKKAKVIRVQGLTVVDEVEYNASEDP